LTKEKESGNICLRCRRGAGKKRSGKKEKERERKERKALRERRLREEEPNFLWSLKGE